jgi:ribosomal protein S18 acetylase RimI-like enzyme
VSAMPVRVREATVDDLDVIVANNVAMAMESEGKPLDGQVVRRGVHRLLLDPERGRYLVAVDDASGGSIVGQLMVTREWSDWRDGWWWWIQSVYVAPSARRRGVYRALHERVVDEANGSADVCGVRLYVEPDNAGAQATYRQLGMTETYRVMEQPKTPASRAASSGASS